MLSKIELKCPKKTTDVKIKNTHRRKINSFIASLLIFNLKISMKNIHFLSVREWNKIRSGVLSIIHFSSVTVMVENQTKLTTRSTIIINLSNTKSLSYQSLFD